MATLLLATLDDTRIAIDAASIAQVIEVATVVPIPHAPDHILGLTAVRSQAITLVDTRRALGKAALAHGDASRAAVVAIDGHSYAFLFERVEDVVETAQPAGPPPAGMGPAWKRIVTGTAETPLGPALLIDPRALISGNFHAAA